MGWDGAISDSAAIGAAMDLQCAILDSHRFCEPAAALRVFGQAPDS